MASVASVLRLLLDLGSRYQKFDHCLTCSESFDLALPGVLADLALLGVLVDLVLLGALADLALLGALADLALLGVLADLALLGASVDLALLGVLADLALLGESVDLDHPEPNLGPVLVAFQTFQLLLFQAALLSSPPCQTQYYSRF